MERGLDRMGTAKSEANSPGMSWKCSYVQEPLKKKKKLLKDQSFSPCPGLSSFTQLNH